MIDLGPDCPLSPEALAVREAIEQDLVNALYCVRHDPIGGNVRQCIERAWMRMETAAPRGHSHGPPVTEPNIQADPNQSKDLE